MTISTPRNTPGATASSGEPEESLRGLCRSKRHSLIAGVCGGIADRFGWKVGTLRALYLCVTVATAMVPGVFFYVVLWLSLPKQNA